MENNPDRPAVGAPGPGRLRLAPLVLLAILANPITFTYAVWDTLRPGYIAGESMAPARHDGELNFSNSWRYRLGEPRRAEIAVVRGPQTHGANYLKRVIALPGETVEIARGAVFIDGEPLAEPYVAPGSWDGELGPLVLGPGEYFVMGDNRARSYDSRSFGPLLREEIVAPDAGVFWPLGRASAGPVAVAVVLLLTALAASLGFAIASARAVRGRWRKVRAARNGLFLWGIGYALAVRQGVRPRRETVSGAAPVPLRMFIVLPLASAVIGASVGNGWVALGAAATLALVTAGMLFAAHYRETPRPMVSWVGRVQVGWLVVFVCLRPGRTSFDVQVAGVAAGLLAMAIALVLARRELATKARGPVARLTEES